MVLPGDTVTASVALDNDEGARGFSMGLAHDGSFLTLISIEAGEVADAGWEGQKVILDASGAEGALATRERKELEFDRLAMLQSVPGVGPATADRLLERFESVAGVAAATAEELSTVSGIGAAKAARILEVLNN